MRFCLFFFFFSFADDRPRAQTQGPGSGPRLRAQAHTAKALISPLAGGETFAVRQLDVKEGEGDDQIVLVLFILSLLSSLSLCACVSACVRACVRVYVRACVRACACVRETNTERGSSQLFLQFRNVLICLSAGENCRKIRLTFARTNRVEENLRHRGLQHVVAVPAEQRG